MRDRDIEHDVARMFAGDVAGHRLIVALDQGLHRHLIFESRAHSWNNRFELITVPGSLTITGDRGSYTFRRLRDMFQFFRCNPYRPHRINAGYWAEKLPDAGRSVKVYSERVARIWIREHLQQAVAERDELQREFDEENSRQRQEWREDLRAAGIEDPQDPDWVPFQGEDEADWPELIQARKVVDDALEILQDYPNEGDIGWEEQAREVLRELERVGLAGDTWEWDLDDWDFHFLWCLNAIAWGIQQYDRAVRAGLHKVRPAPVPWDQPLPTTAPEGGPAKELEPIEFVVTMAAPRVVATAVTGDVL